MDQLSAAARLAWNAAAPAPCRVVVVSPGRRPLCPCALVTARYEGTLQPFVVDVPARVIVGRDQVLSLPRTPEQYRSKQRHGSARAVAFRSAPCTRVLLAIPAPVRPMLQARIGRCWRDCRLANNTHVHPVCRVTRQAVGDDVRHIAACNNATQHKGRIRD